MCVVLYAYRYVCVWYCVHIGMYVCGTVCIQVQNKRAAISEYIRDYMITKYGLSIKKLKHEQILISKYGTSKSKRKL